MLTSTDIRDLECGIVYVGGDGDLGNLRRPEQTWNLRLIEADFQRRMFEVQETKRWPDIS